MNTKIEHFLLYELNDDWASLGTFDGVLHDLEPEHYSRARVIGIIRNMISSGYVRLGNPSHDWKSWIPWDRPIDDEIDRVAHGYNGGPGYLDMDTAIIGRTEIFRAQITDKGRQRLHELGNPYDVYGDPWAGTTRRLDE